MTGVQTCALPIYDKWGEVPVAIVVTDRGGPIEETVQRLCASELS